MKSVWSYGRLRACPIPSVLAILAALLGSACSPRQTVAPTPAPSAPRASTSSPDAPQAPVSPSAIVPVPISIPGGTGGIGFDDLRYSARLKRVIVPAGHTGKLDLLDPVSRAITEIGGFSTGNSYRGGHGQGTTSAEEGEGMLFAIDRTGMKVSIIDPGSRAIVTSAALAGKPDYVRYVAPTRELWVTQPSSERIEVFKLSDSSPPTPVHAGIIAVKGGPESLVIDATRGRAYTHLWKGMSVAIDLKTRAIVARWPNGCDQSQGIALDEARGFLFVACAGGKAVVLDVAHEGQVLSTGSSGSDVDVIDYNPKLSHLYFPGAESATMGIFGVSKAGQLTLLGVAPTAKDAHCVAADDLGNAYVCDPNSGQLLLVKDPYPASGE